MALKNKLSKLLSGVVVLPLVLASASAHAKSVYVSVKGLENGTGTMASPFKTIGKAMKSDLKPGDEVIVKEGRYSENVVVGKDGTESAYITLRSEEPGGAVIDVPDNGQLGINVAANYVVVEGFEVTGSAKSGIGGRRVHHVKILNNESHHNRTGGIAFQESEFLTIEGNLVHGNANYSVISGISILHAQNITGDKSDKGFRIIVRGNTSHSNMAVHDAHTDGNGIIIDRFRDSAKGTLPPYQFPTLVENNIVYNNGGKGIQLAFSDYVTVRNNVAYNNSQDLKSKSTWRAEINNMNGSNNTFVNNITYANPKVNKHNKGLGNVSMTGYKNTNVNYRNNITFNGTVGDACTLANNQAALPTAANGNKLGVNPRFINAPENFHLQSDSPAIDSGSSSFGVGPYDFDGSARVVRTIDIGAHEAGN